MDLGKVYKTLHREFGVVNIEVTANHNGGDEVTITMPSFGLVKLIELLEIDTSDTRESDICAESITIKYDDIMCSNKVFMEVTSEKLREN